MARAKQPSPSTLQELPKLLASKLSSLTSTRRQARKLGTSAGERNALSLSPRRAVVLSDVLKTSAEHGADFAIIDTAPHSETAALTAGKAADLILVPCRASAIDLKAIETTIDLVMLARKPALFVLSCIRPGDKGPTEQRRNSPIAISDTCLASTHHPASSLRPRADCRADRY